MIKQILIPTAVTSTLIVGVSAAQAESIFLDDFTQGEQYVRAIPTNPMVMDTMTGLNTLGGSRTISLNLETGRRAEFYAENGSLTWDNPTGAKSKATVLWDADGNGLDADFSKQLGIDVLVEALDLDAEVEFILTDLSDREAKLSRSGLQEGTTESFLFDDFIEEPSFNYNKVESVLLSLSGPSAVDAMFQLIELPENPDFEPVEDVPEPNTMLGIFAVGGAGFLARRRKS